MRVFVIILRDLGLSQMRLGLCARVFERSEADLTGPDGPHPCRISHKDHGSQALPSACDTKIRPAQPENPPVASAEVIDASKL